jgi:hypothetical protein
MYQSLMNGESDIDPDYDIASVKDKFNMDDEIYAIEVMSYNIRSGKFYEIEPCFSAFQNYMECREIGVIMDYPELYAEYENNYIDRWNEFKDEFGLQKILSSYYPVSLDMKMHWDLNLINHSIWRKAKRIEDERLAELQKIADAEKLIEDERLAAELEVQREHSRIAMEAELERRRIKLQLERTFGTPEREAALGESVCEYRARHTAVENAISELFENGQSVIPQLVRKYFKYVVATKHDSESGDSFVDSFYLMLLENLDRLDVVQAQSIVNKYGQEFYDEFERVLNVSVGDYHQSEISRECQICMEDGGEFQCKNDKCQATICYLCVINYQVNDESILCSCGRLNKPTISQ